MLKALPFYLRYSLEVQHDNQSVLASPKAKKELISIMRRTFLSYP